MFSFLRSQPHRSMLFRSEISTRDLLCYRQCLCVAFGSFRKLCFWAGEMVQPLKALLTAKNIKKICFFFKLLVVCFIFQSLNVYNMNC